MELFENWNNLIIEISKIVRKDWAAAHNYMTFNILISRKPFKNKDGVGLSIYELKIWPKSEYFNKNTEGYYESFDILMAELLSYVDEQKENLSICDKKDAVMFFVEIKSCELKKDGKLTNIYYMKIKKTIEE